jgi:hypothetical protein
MASKAGDERRKQLKMKKATPRQLDTQRSVLTGAALGLCFGLFFRPLRDPNYLTPLAFGLAAALLTTIIRHRQAFPPLPRLLRDIGFAFLTFGGFLLVLALRHAANALGGRLGVIALTTISCAVLGWLMALQRPRDSKADKRGQS